MRLTRVALTVSTDNPEILTRAIETMSRAAAGLAMEDIDTLFYTSAEEAADG